MSFYYNHVVLVGRLTRDPDFKVFSEGVQKVFFMLAVSRSHNATETDYIPVCMWGKTAVLANDLLKKGLPVLIWGRLQVRPYGQDNDKKWMTEVIAENFQILQKKSQKAKQELEQQVD